MVDLGDKFDEQDIEALREWVISKRQVTVSDRGGNLSIAGEVRTEYQARTETVNGIRQLNPGGAVKGTATNNFDVEVNLMLDYRTERTWAGVKLEFDNNMGTTSGTFNKLVLERAFLGGRAVSADLSTLDIEVGRRPFGYTFDSRIEFASFMDGILFSYDHALDNIGDAYAHAGPFLIDETLNQFGIVAEIGLLNMFNTGLYLKYSIIDWDTHHYSNPLLEDTFSYINSQVVLGYKWRPAWLERNITIYSGWLLNHAAKRLAVTNWHKENYGAYIGFSLGQVRKRGDWSFDFNTQVVAAQAVFPGDFSGIGHGNAARRGLYSTNIDGTGDATTVHNAGGSENYKGFVMEFLYMITNNITIYQSYQQSTRLNHHIGQPFFYRQYELEVIYAF